MVLDALIKIKTEQDSGLTFRRSCREGVRLVLHEHRWPQHACLRKAIEDIAGAAKVHPLPPWR